MPHFVGLGHQLSTHSLSSNIGLKAPHRQRTGKGVLKCRPTLVASLPPSENELSPSGGIFDVDGKKERIADLDRQSMVPEFWNDASRARGLLREKTTLERKIVRFENLVRTLEDAETLLELWHEDPNTSLETEAELLLSDLESKVKEAEVQRLFSDEGDECHAVLEINSGAGGTDAADWALMMMRMYLRWAERMGFKVKLLDEQPNEDAGIKSCSIEVEGAYAYGYLKSEIGVHRLVRISPFDSNARRQTSFASVGVWPIVDDDIDIQINEKDLEIQTMRSGGAGGQHVNMTDSAVRIIHHPSGIVVKCQNERSQLKNKATAMKMLKARLYQQELEKRQEARDAVLATKKKIEWGSQIRSYVIHPYRLVKDTRTGCESGDTDSVLDGRLTPFMESWLSAKANGTLGAGEQEGAV
jgi:peptide chain release factor 2